MRRYNKDEATVREALARHNGHAGRAADDLDEDGISDGEAKEAHERVKAKGSRLWGSLGKEKKTVTNPLYLAVQAEKNKPCICIPEESSGGGHSGPVWDLVHNKKGTMVASASAFDGSVRVWELPNEGAYESMLVKVAHRVRRSKADRVSADDHAGASEAS